MIVCFSGTGNTRSAALQLAARLGDSHVVFPDAAMLRDPGSAVLMPGEQDSCIVWAFPVYGWGMPPVVERLIRSAKLEGRGALLPHYMLATCGDDIGRTDRHWRRAMAERGWKAAGAFVVRMPNTFVFMPGFNVDSEAAATRKLSDAPAVIARIADMIGGKSPVEDIVIPGAMPGLKSGLLRSFFWDVYMKPRRFRSTDACIGCGTCARSCPMENITIEDGRPHWGDACAYCLRCYHVCPCHAVDYLHTTSGKGRYLNPEGCKQPQRKTNNK